ncbi:MAG: hypothetical protein WA960_15125 [Tunicatimonas sp.]
MTKTFPRISFRWPVPLALLCLIACTPQSPVSELGKKPYFDVPSLVQQQLQWLDSLNPPVTLRASISGETQTQTLRKDSTAWAETFDLFRQADINQPVLQGAYEETDSVTQDSLRVRTYRAKRASTAEIPYLRVFYRDSLANVYRIETMFQEDNVLYSTSRKMWMTFAQRQGRPRIIAFETQGKQKMMLRDSVTYSARGELQYD